jgi:hypothetical protein
MIKFENYEVVGWEHAIRGMRNPKNSWDRMDSEPGCEIVTGSHEFCRECDHAIDIHGKTVCDNGYKPGFVVGCNDHELMMKLAKAGPVHAKYRRMITVYVDITAPLYWWKEFDTYKVGTVANSCSTMHKIHAKEFTLDDFSTERLFNPTYAKHNPLNVLKDTIAELNYWRETYIKTVNADLDAPVWMVNGREADSHDIWYNMIQLLPSSYNQKRTVMMNYEVLSNIHEHRENHKLDEWKELCKWITTLPYSEIITTKN